MPKVTYDFHVESIITIEASENARLEDLLRSAKIKLVERVNNNDITIVLDGSFENNHIESGENLE